MERFEGGRSEVGAATVALRLVGIERAAVDIAVLTFESTGGAALPQAAPGAHLDLHLPGGLVRPYSLLTPLCTPSRQVIAVKRQADGRGGSRAVHDVLKVGDVVEAGAPRNHFPLDPHATHPVLLAGGIGITPLYAMYEQLRAAGRWVQLHYWCRSAAHALFHERLIDAPGVWLHFSEDKPSEDKPSEDKPSQDKPSEHRSRGGPVRGPWQSLSSVVEDLPAGTDVYCCGPQTMLGEVSSLLAARADVSLHLEHFHPVATPAPAAGEATGFEVALARSGKTFEVRPGQTILEVLIDASVDVAYSCEEGVCGACETKLIEGVPIHRDSVYSVADHERRGTVMICCAGSRSKRLVLDL